MGPLSRARSSAARTGRLTRPTPTAAHRNRCRPPTLKATPPQPDLARHDSTAQPSPRPSSQPPSRAHDRRPCRLAPGGARTHGRRDQRAVSATVPPPWRRALRRRDDHRARVSSTGNAQDHAAARRPSAPRSAASRGAIQLYGTDARHLGLAAARHGRRGRRRRITSTSTSAVRRAKVTASTVAARRFRCAARLLARDRPPRWSRHAGRRARDGEVPSRASTTG
jgi:hypothetical protein